MRAVPDERTSVRAYVDTLSIELAAFSVAGLGFWLHLMRH